ncbi:hypothetical protein PMSV_1151 [Photobacterium leiognathi subsp. mandapamensis svers.1.1.]|nr:hypothetical protein PMSV_1151 [Photobacterium leiognathi subsp. mandapamensis svers.1.1.]
MMSLGIHFGSKDSERAALLQVKVDNMFSEKAFKNKNARKIAGI